MRTYTAEVYRLPYPSRGGRRLRVRAGSYESNRDTLSPGLVSAWEVRADSLTDANRLAAARTAGRMRRGNEFTRDLPAYNPGGRLRRGHAATPHRHTHGGRS